MSSEIPTGAVQDNDYTMRSSQKGGPIPVQSDDAKIEDPIDAEVADSDQQLVKDDKEAIDQSNIISGGRTRGAKPEGTYQEPGDEEGLPEEDGRSAIAQ
ncbi:hypothetical protein GLAREA_08667 [Glarea lozoyensis ATCC 20868]|uniref:Histone chaperone domain-containing protein n=1 Tax=Glarea lozoyensis (strain ATCC 20868 / MF5171) TaxID=1116229 RepID=S3DH69_GLAL2|nr:uncharacterized protein GLAREA_08667 [Glarea lozoyensis ATCC 20868]EPE36504.1 hypothetical protein GLAREA_08667 [Glarea lozoyensis ATCC 20868]